MPIGGQGLMVGLNEGLKSALDAYVKMKQLKNADDRLEQERLNAELDRATKTKMAEQEAVKNRGLLFKEGIDYDEATGSFSRSPEYLKQQQREETMKAVQAGARPIRDETGAIVGYEQDPEAPGNIYKQLQGGKLVADIRKAQEEGFLATEGMGLKRRELDIKSEQFKQEQERLRQKESQDFLARMAEKGLIRVGTDAQGNPVFQRTEKQMTPLEEAKLEQIKAQTEKLKQVPTPKPLSPVDEARAELIKEQAISERAKRSAPKKPSLTKGQEALDRAFAKEYDEWTSAGKPAYEKNLQRLQEAKAALKKAKGGVLGASGRVMGLLPEVLRPESALTIQQDVQAAAQGALRATLGAQFTEKEGERIMRMAYDPRLSEEENIRKIDMAIAEIEKQAAAKDAKAMHFEETGSLSGFRSGGTSKSLLREPAPEAGAKPKFKPGDRRTKNGITYERDSKGKWRPVK